MTKFDITIPAVVMALPPRRNEVTRCVVKRDIVLDIEDASADDVAVCVSFTGGYLEFDVTSPFGQQSAIAVRHRDGKFYRPLESVDSLREALADPFSKSRIAEAHRAKVWDALGGRPPPWPTSIDYAVRSAGAMHPAAVKAFDSQSPKLVLDAQAQADAARWEREFASHFDGSLIVDGGLWSECAEPTLRLEATATGVLIPDVSGITPMNGAASFFFAPDGLDDATSFLEAMGVDPRAAVNLFTSCGNSVAVHDPSPLRADHARLGLLATAQDVAGSMAAARLDPGALRERASLSSELLAEAIDAGMSQLRRADLQTPDPRFVQAHIDRWMASPVSVPVAPGRRR